MTQLYTCKRSCCSLFLLDTSICNYAVKFAKVLRLAMGAHHLSLKDRREFSLWWRKL